MDFLVSTNKMKNQLRDELSLKIQFWQKKEIVANDEAQHTAGQTRHVGA